MTHEEIRKICDSMWQADLLNADIQKVREALEKQKLPKKPRDKVGGVLIRGFCPNCLNTVYSYSVYCDRCGQHLDWEEE